MSLQDVESKKGMSLPGSNGEEKGVYAASLEAYHPSEVHDLGLKKKLSTRDVVVLGYMVLATWIAYSGSIAVPLTSGGINVFFWGMLICIIANLCSAASLAEVASVFPYGNQESWSYHLSPDNNKRFCGYLVGWLLSIGYILLGLAGEAITAQIILAMANLSHPSYQILPWHVSVMIVAVCISCTLFGIFGSAVLAKLNHFALAWNLCGVIAISIVLLVQSKGTYNTAPQAFVDLTNQSGWSNTFIPWVAALGQAALSTTAYDAVSHFSCEMKTPERSLPIGMVSAVALNGVVGLAYALVLCFTLPVDPTSLLSTTTGFPFAQLLLDKTGSVGGSVFMLFILFLPFWNTVCDVNMASARILLRFASQGGAPRVLSKTNTMLDSPVNAAIVVAIIQIGLSFIYLGSTSAFISFISAPGIVLALSYAAVALLMLVRGRKALDTKPTFHLGAIAGPICNVVTVLFSLILLVFLSLPSVYPVTKTNMNYTIVIVVAAVISGCLMWPFYGRKWYTGPINQNTSG